MFRRIRMVFDRAAPKAAPVCRRKASRRLAFELCEARHMMDALPLLSSLPGAPATLLLDFNGSTILNFHTETVPYGDIHVPAFDRDNNPASFNATEVSEIQRIWERVAEDYAPFNINVTTNEAGLSANDFQTKKAFRVAIGGDCTEISGSLAFSSGVTVLGSFANANFENVSFVWDKAPDFLNSVQFPEEAISEIASHEAGHGFGLVHQHQYDPNDGHFIQEYDPGDPQRAPIMGDSTHADRGLWWITPANAQGGHQDDMAIIAGSANGFGYRPDDYGNTIAQPTSLGTVNTLSDVASKQGVINRFDDGGVNADFDYFSVTLPNNVPFLGNWHVTVNTIDNGPNLDAKLFVYDGSGNLIASDDPSSTLGADIQLLTGGSYKFAVASHGGVGDYGQYTIKVAYQSNGLLRNLRLISLPPLIDTVCDPAGPYPPWGRESLVQLAKLVIVQDARLDGAFSRPDAQLLINDPAWRRDLYTRTAATLNRALAGHVRTQLDVESFNTALNSLWNDPAHQMPALLAWTNIARR